MKSKIIPGAILIGIGLLFFLNNQNIGKGAATFYKKIYTEKNLIVMFKISGVILILGGLALVFLK